SERAEEHESPAAGGEHGFELARKEVEVDREILAQRSRHRRKDALPFHAESSVIIARLPSAAGFKGGRTVSESQPKRNSRAGPHTRPWHGPMPARVASLASRAPAARTAAASSARGRKTLSMAAARRRPRARARESRRTSAVPVSLSSRPAAASPAISPSAIAVSRPATPQGSPAANTPGAVVRWSSSTTTAPL